MCDYTIPNRCLSCWKQIDVGQRCWRCWQPCRIDLDAELDKMLKKDFAEPQPSFSDEVRKKLCSSNFPPENQRPAR